MVDSQKSDSESDGAGPAGWIFDAADAQAERFFAEGEHAANADTLAPSSADAEPEEEGAPPPRVSPELLQRRTRLRRLVAVGLGGAVALLGLEIGATRLSRVSPVGVATTPAVARVPAPKPPGTTEHPAAPLSVARQSVAPDVTPPAASAPSSAPVTAGPTDAPSPDPTRVARLIGEARSLLRFGRTREGVAAARSALEADPTLGEPYVLLAAGLEDLGRWSEAQRTFVACAERTHDEQCSYFAKSAR